MGLLVNDKLRGLKITRFCQVIWSEMANLTITSLPTFPKVEDLKDVDFGTALPVVEAFKRHRFTHPTNDDLKIVLTRDKGMARYLSPTQTEALVHVLTCLAYGTDVIGSQMAQLARRAESSGSIGNNILSNVRDDTFVANQLCQRYLWEVFQVFQMPPSNSESFMELIDKALVRRFTEYLAADSSQGYQGRTAKIVAEAKYRTACHLVCELTGAVGGLQGIRMALNDQQADYGLQGLVKTIDSLCLIERRNIAFGLSCLARLMKENYLATIKAVISEVREHKPLLKKIREEALERWNVLPFNINIEKLESRRDRNIRSKILGLVALRYSKFKTFEMIA